MKNKFINIACAVNAVAVTLVIAFCMESPVAVHFGPSGAADRYGSKWEYLMFAVMPIFFAVIFKLITSRVKNNPNKKYEGKAFPMIVYLFIALGWIFISVVLRGKTELENSALNLVMVPIGLLMVYLSNMYPKLEPNHTFGIRIKPTLTDENVWKKTHRLGAYTGFVGGIIITAGAVVGYATGNVVVTFTSFGLGIALTVAVPIIYAYAIYKK